MKLYLLLRFQEKIRLVPNNLIFIPINLSRNSSCFSFYLISNACFRSLYTEKEKLICDLIEVTAHYSEKMRGILLQRIMILLIISVLLRYIEDY